MAKATAYKRKKNLEVPPTYQGNSFAILSNDSLASHVVKVDITIGNDNASRIAIINDLVDDENRIVWLLPMLILTLSYLKI